MSTLVPLCVWCATARAQTPPVPVAPLVDPSDQVISTREDRVPAEESATDDLIEVSIERLHWHVPDPETDRTRILKVLEEAEA